MDRGLLVTIGTAVHVLCVCAPACNDRSTIPTTLQPQAHLLDIQHMVLLDVGGTDDKCVQHIASVLTNLTRQSERSRLARQRALLLHSPTRYAIIDEVWTR